MLLDRLFRSAENPSCSLADPANWLFEAWGGKSTAGVTITNITALGLAAVWRAQNLISRDVGKLPLFVLARGKDDGRERFRTHPAYRLLRRRPNPWMTPIVFKQLLTHHVLGFGNGYAHIFRDPAGRPTDLVPMGPEETDVKVDDKTGNVFYTNMLNGVERRILPENVLHIRGLGYDGLKGYSVLTVARDSLGLGIAARDFGSRFFSNGATPRLVLEHPGILSNDEEVRQRWREKFEQTYGGLSNSHKMMLLEQGIKANVLSANAKDSQLMELRQFEIREVANIFGVPPHKLGDPSRTSFASLEQENQSYVDEALDGWLVVWEEECTAKLCTEREKETESAYCEFNRGALVRADMTARYAAYRVAVDGGWMSVNEVRAKENLNSINLAGGEFYRFPLNTGYLGDDGGIVNPNVEAKDTATPEPQPPGSDADDGEPPAPANPAARAAVAKLFRRVCVHARRASRDADRYGEFCDAIEQKHGPAVVAALGTELGAAVMDGLRDHFLAAAQVQPVDLARSVELACAEASCQQFVQDYCHGATV